MRARRLIFLLEYLATNENNQIDTKSVRRILKSTILLPSELFPIPNRNKELYKKNEEAKKERKKIIENRKNEINNTVEKLRINNEAIEELSSAYSKHLFDIKTTPQPGGSRTSLALIPPDKFNLLSSETKNVVLKNIGIKENEVDVAYSIKTLEAQNKNLSSKMNLEFNFDNSAPENDVAIAVEKTCGACRVIIIDDVKKENNFTGQTAGKVNKIEDQNLMIVRQKLLKYEAGEIAHIENVLEGERKSKSHRKLHRVEKTVFEESEKSEEVENELQTTDRFELQTQTSETISQDTSMEAGVTVTGSYGPVKVEAHGNYTSNNASEESRNSAMTYGKDVVSRSVSKINERVLNRRSRTDITEVEVINKHKIDNSTDPTKNIAGIYRWVNKLYEAQIVNYGRRTMLEFMIPEPSAFYRFALTKNPNNEINIIKPDEPGFCQSGKFSKLKPTDLTATSYMCFVGKYGVSDVEPPPARFVHVVDIMQYKTESPGLGVVPIAEKNDKFKITKGYIPKTVNYKITGGNTNSILVDKHDELLIQVTIGSTRAFSIFKSAVGFDDSWSKTKQLIDWDNNFTDEEINKFHGEKRGKLADTILVNVENDSILDENPNIVPISITGHSTLPITMTLHYSVLCERSASLYQQWQIDTYKAIMSSYYRLKLEYDEAVQNQQFTSEINIQGQNPFVNREVEKTELKKNAISILTGQQYEGFNAMWQDHRQGYGYPEIDLQDAAEEGEFVQFFEQAFEWQHITYLFYDYFWGRKQNWLDKLHTKDTDPLFEKFLRAGYSRVWIPIRPGFESVVGNYICAGGEPWTEKDAPQCSESDSNDNVIQKPMLSMIDEMKEQLDNEFIEREGTITVTNNSKVVNGENTDFTEDDVDREILLNLKSYRIAEFISANEIILRDPYLGEDTTLGVSLGVKYVGEPWVVQVPTSLVHLKDDGEL
jgi:hypothetical protein